MTLGIGRTSDQIFWQEWGDTMAEPSTTLTQAAEPDEVVQKLVGEVMKVERKYANELRNVQSERREGIQRAIEKLASGAE